jgi:hypothetical protein
VRERADQRVVQAAEHDDAEVVALAGEGLVQLALDDAPARGGQPLVDLELLVPERDRRMREARVVERRGLLERMPGRDRRRDVVAAVEAAAHVARADAQLQDRRQARRLGQRERLVDEAHHVLELGARIEEHERRLERVRERALLDDARALAVVLADDDQRAAGDAGRGEVRQRVGRRRWCRRSTSR